MRLSFIVRRAVAGFVLVVRAEAVMMKAGNNWERLTDTSVNKTGFERAFDGGGFYRKQSFFVCRFCDFKCDCIKTEILNHFKKKHEDVIDGFYEGW